MVRITNTSKSVIRFFGPDDAEVPERVIIAPGETGEVSEETWERYEGRADVRAAINRGLYEVNGLDHVDDGPGLPPMRTEERVSEADTASPPASDPHEDEEPDADTTDEAEDAEDEDPYPAGDASMRWRHEELMAYADDLGVEVPEDATKADLLKAIQEAEG